MAETTARGYEGNGKGKLEGRVIAVAGAAGPAGAATLLRLAEEGATVAAADADAERLATAVDSARFAHGGATVTGETLNLMDFEATREWADETAQEFGRIDGLIHLVGGWRGSATFAETNFADWDALHGLLIRTVQHTSLAFEKYLKAGDNSRYLLISAAGASSPTAGNAAYAASKAAAEAWTLALGDAFRKAGGDSGPSAAAAILIVKALVHDQMRADRPDARFAGFTDVKDLAGAIVDTWTKPAEEVNGTRLWLTPKP